MSCWINITATCLSYELGLHVAKRSMETWNIIKNGHSEDDLFHTSKSGSFKSLRGNFYYGTVTSNLIEEEIQCQHKVLWFLSHPLDVRYRAIPEALEPANIIAETRAKNCSKAL